ncbi:MAG: caspase family protein, partial [Pyrinomonadaceae bacterium]
AYAFNRDNVKSADAELSLRGGANLKRPGVIYILAVGLDQYANAQYNLKFAAADARVFADEVRRAQAELAPPARLEVVTLFDHEATKANVLHALTRLSGDASAALPPGAPPSLNKLQPAQPEDTVIVFHAGHGMAFGQRFYLLPHDFGYTGARAAIEQDGVQAILGHSISDRELEQVLEGVDAGRLLMVLDTCESGKVLESEEQRQRQGPMNSKGIAQLAYEKGMFVLTAAQSYQAALEVEQLGHGFLTHALVVQGLREGRADARPRDGRIMTGEWLDYATERVPQLQLEWMRTTRGLMSQIAFVAGEEWLNDPGDRSLQRPRVFYRRETQRRPLIIAQLGAVRSGQ